MNSRLNIALLACALLAALPADAQRLYKYTDPATGKTVYTERLPAEAAGKANEQLNRQGTVVKREAPAPTAEELAAREADRKRRLDEEMAAKEEKRKNQALLNTYADEKDIDEARGRALQVNDEAIKDAERKLADAQKRQKLLASEAEFFQKKPMPMQLKLDIQNNQAEMKAHGDLLDAKRKETASINAKYDEDKRRYLELSKTGTVATAAPAPTSAKR
jgi:Domain of unknown function (DUF4124)